MELSLKRCCRYALRFWWVIVAAAVIGGFIGFLTTMRDADYFRAEGEVRVDVDITQNSDSMDALDFATARVIEMIENRDFLTARFDEAGASGLYKDRQVTEFVTATRNTDSGSVITISCMTPSRSWSTDIVKGIMDNLPAQIPENSAYAVTTASTAQIVETQTSSRTMPTAVGVVAGAVIAFVVLIVISVIDNRIYWRDELEDGRLPLLGDLSGKRSRQDEPFALGKYGAAEAEEVRRMRAEFAGALARAGGAKSVLVVSDCASVDTAKATLKLVCAVVAEEHKAIVMELDRKTSSLGDVLGLSGRTLNEYLAGKAKASDIGADTHIEGLRVITAHANGTSAMTDDMMTARLANELKGSCDELFMLAAPVNVGADAYSCEAADAVLLVVKRGKTGRRFLRHACDTYISRGMPVLGIILI